MKLAGSQSLVKCRSSSSTTLNGKSANVGESVNVILLLIYTKIEVADSDTAKESVLHDLKRYVRNPQLYP